MSDEESGKMRQCNDCFMYYKKKDGHNCANPALSKERPTIYLYDRLRAVHTALRAALEPTELNNVPAMLVARRATHLAEQAVAEQLTALLNAQDSTEQHWGKIFWCPAEHVWWTGSTHVCPEKLVGWVAPAQPKTYWRLSWNALDRPIDPAGPETTTSTSFPTYAEAVEYAKQNVLGRSGVVGMWFEEKKVE